MLSMKKRGEMTIYGLFYEVDLNEDGVAEVLILKVFTELDEVDFEKEEGTGVLICTFVIVII